MSTALCNPSSALQLDRIKGNQGQCVEPGCHRAGRYTICIASWYVEKAGILAGKATLCKECAEGQRDLWAELSGETYQAKVLIAIRAIGANRSDRVHGIWALQELGYDTQEIASVLAAVGERKPVEEILDALMGEPELALTGGAK